MIKLRNMFSPKVVAVAGIAAAALGGSAAAFADASAATTAISSVSTDVSTIGWAVIGVLVVAAGFKYLRRAL